jgi:cytochrome P450
VCRDPAQLRSELLNVLLAARDMTAGLLSSILYFVARHADVWAALMAEVEQLEGRVPDYDTLKRMHVLRSIIDESKFLRPGWKRVFLLIDPTLSALRLHPPVPINMRFAERDTTIPRGGGPDGLSPVFVAKGAAVHYSVWAMHRRRPSTAPTLRRSGLRVGLMLAAATTRILRRRCDPVGDIYHLTAARACVWASRVR